MENGSGETMGATTANNLPRIAALQERKKQIEETLAKRTQELRQLCIQEAELTGLTPPEMPLEPGETLPCIRRKIGTSYQLPESLVENVNHKDEMIAELELQLKLHANMAEAALGLANEQGLSKTIKRQHKNEYQKHRQQCNLLQEKLDKLKDKEREQQHKLKKKQPRMVEVVEKSLSMVEPFQKSEVRHSLRSLKYGGDIEGDARHSGYRYSENPLQMSQEEAILTSGIYRLSLNGYNRYMESREHHRSHQIESYSPYTSPPYPQYSPQSSHSFYHHHNYPTHTHPSYTNYYHDYSPSIPSSYYPSNSPSKTPPSSQYYPYDYNCTSTRREEPISYRNSQVLQPHQQYEAAHTNVVSMGLGGCWKQNENGELVWSHSSPDTTWQYREKKHTAGVLDRRKHKKMPKQRTYLGSDKSATLGTVPNYHNQSRSVKMLHDSTDGGGGGRQLVRTQSLGSVGAHTIDSVYPSDDASSCGSENRALRRNKAKEWTETSLDSPVLAPEEKYRNDTPTPPPPLPPPPSAKVLEIPAESKPSPSQRISEPNMEFFNNNIPKNCTVVQAGQCKPYREETKPFEMSDFYKYSTKFKRSPSKSEGEPGGSASLRRGYDDGYNNINNLYANNNNISRV